MYTLAEICLNGTEIVVGCCSAALANRELEILSKRYGTGTLYIRYR